MAPPPSGQLSSSLTHQLNKQHNGCLHQRDKDQMRDWPHVSGRFEQTKQIPA
jgi:hypothetical protein